MKSAIFLITATCASSAFAATTAQLYVDKLNTSDGIGNPAAGAAWVLIYDQNNDSSLPGGLTDGSSLSASNANFIKTDFDNLTIADNAVLANGDRIIATGTVPLDGIINSEVVTFDIGIGANQEATGRRFALYWFPDMSVNDTIDTSLDFSIGGFYESAPHAGSFSDYGMLVPSDNESGLFLAFDSASGWDEGRLVAIAVPETSTLTLSALGMAALLRRRRG